MLKVGVIDFFCGCGGVSSGIKQVTHKNVSIDIITGIDIDKYCCETYRKMIVTNCEQGDILSYSQNSSYINQRIAEWKLKEYDKIFLVGCAPCQGFAAHRKSNDGEDVRRNLFEEFCKVAAIINPDIILMENVPDIFSQKYWKYFEAGKAILEESKFVVKSNIYNFATFGLPQERFRAVIIAAKNDFEMPVGKLQPSDFRTVRDAIGNLPQLDSGGCSGADPMHIVSKHRPSTIKILEMVPPDGGNRPYGIGPKCLDRARTAHGGYTDVYGRLAWDRPAVTITGRCRTPSCGRFAHPDQNRGLSIREAALLQGFPTSFVFEGPFDDKYKQIGNAVPPLVAKHLADHVIKILQGTKDTSPKLGCRPPDVSFPVGPGFAVTINGIKKKRTKVSI